MWGYVVHLGQMTAAATAPDKHWLEVCYWLSQMALPFIAALGVWLAVYQLRAIKKQAKATFLLELDRRFEDDQMSEARQLLHDNLTQIKARVGERHNIANDKERMGRVRLEFAELLKTWQKAEYERYSKIMRFVSFFETVGVMVEQKYVDMDAIDGLLRGPIAHVDLCFRLHIQERQNETGMPDGLYKHALGLADKICRRIDR